MQQLGIPYFYLSDDLIEQAKERQPRSICSWCSRMKRGMIYTCCRYGSALFDVVCASMLLWLTTMSCLLDRREGYNVLAFAQHMDDFAESFMMSFFFNGDLRTMKAHYTIEYV
jgi:tRNA 2-thiocytidine biosynthesis protein TtcA